jgi:hypothetical protein
VNEIERSRELALQFFWTGVGIELLAAVANFWSETMASFWTAAGVVFLLRANRQFLDMEFFIKEQKGKKQ